MKSQAFFNNWFQISTIDDDWMQNYKIENFNGESVSSTKRTKREAINDPLGQCNVTPADPIFFLFW